MSPVRILFVDDEQTIRLTLPPILEAHGFAVEVTATVAEALAKISSGQFDVLIADLNVGQPGDGFTVVSAMRRTQPNCINFILTGFPAFETALEAIRRQVDDYLLKPIEIHDLVALIESKLQAHEPHSYLSPKRVAEILREKTGEITSEVLAMMKAHPELRQLRLSDDERIDQIPTILQTIVSALESNNNSFDDGFLRAAATHGRLRLKQGYLPPLMVEDARLLEEAIYDAVQGSMLSVDVSHLIPDLRVVNRTLETQLRESLKAYSKAA
jgi:ActR/RegA family two-component response regulator